MSKKLMLLAAASALVMTPAAARNGKPDFAPWGVDLTAMDSGVKPGDDFFAYVNGAWAKRTQIAPDRTFVGIDSILNDQLDKDVRAIVEDMARNPAGSGKIGRQVGDFYASWMDEARIASLGAAPLKPYLDRIGAVKDSGDLVELFATTGYESPVSLGFFPDLADPTKYAVYAGQAGLGMPNRDYYLLQGAKYDGYRTAYRAYVTKIQELAGIADAAARADRIIALETAIARVHWTPEESR
jgi:endothelin-converting enzyme/putative endopeptidase